jgi:DNA-binding NtrC family response regulator
VKRVLIVEDDRPIRGLLEHLVGFMGLVPVPSGSVADALSRIGPDVDLILLDLRLPNGHGFEILERMAERRNDIPVVVVSVYEQEREKEPPVPVLAWIRKPFQLADVRQAIERACDFSTNIASIRQSTERLEKLGSI